MDRLIRVKVDGHHLVKDHRTAGVQHESNAAKMRIEFDPSWDEYAKKITFWNADGKKPVERMLTADLLENITENSRVYRCFIPGEAMTEAGDLTFIIDGYVDGKRQRSLSDTLEVEPAPYIEQADQPADPTPTQAEQLQVQIEALLGNVQANAIRAEQARLGAEEARQDARDIIGGQAVPESFLKDKADLVSGKIPKAQLPTLTAADVGAAPVVHTHKASDVGAFGIRGSFVTDANEFKSLGSAMVNGSTINRPSGVSNYGFLWNLVGSETTNYVVQNYFDAANRKWYWRSCVDDSWWTWYLIGPI